MWVREREIRDGGEVLVGILEIWDGGSQDN